MHFIECIEIGISTSSIFKVILTNYKSCGIKKLSISDFDIEDKNLELVDDLRKELSQ